MMRKETTTHNNKQQATNTNNPCSRERDNDNMTVDEDDNSSSGLLANNNAADDAVVRNNDKASLLAAHLKRQKQKRGIFLWHLAKFGTTVTVIMLILAGVVHARYGDLYADGHTTQDYFSSYGASLYTLFQIMTLDDWGNISREVLDAKPLAWIIFVLIVDLMAFLVFPYMTAMMVDASIIVETHAVRHELQVLRERHDVLEQKVDQLLAILAPSSLHAAPSASQQQQQPEGAKGAAASLA